MNVCNPPTQQTYAVKKRKFKGIKETDPAGRAYRVSSYAAIRRLYGKEIWKAPYSHRTEDMTVGRSKL